MQLINLSMIINNNKILTNNVDTNNKNIIIKKYMSGHYYIGLKIDLILFFKKIV